MEKKPYKSTELEEISSRIGWKGTLKRLIRRIKAVFSRTTFSVRERKRLKKIIKKDYIGRSIDYEEVLQEFPGKNLEILREECEKIFSSFSKRLNKS